MNDNFWPSFRKLASSLGIDALGVVQAGPTQTYDTYLAAISNGQPPQLGYLIRNAQCRRDFNGILPDARSVICAACALPNPPAHSDEMGDFAQFCSLGNYHDIMRARLGQILDFIAPALGIARARICVDSAPVLERELAVRAGLGAIGYNHQLIHPDLGSQILLSECFVDVDLMPFAHEMRIMAHVMPPSALIPGGVLCCPKESRACIKSCPTGALSSQGYDVNRCLSYWSTQHRGIIPDTYKRAMGRQIWGCDRCQQNCPRARHRALRKPDAIPSPLTNLTYNDILSLSARALKKKLDGSPLADAHPYMIARNACIVIGNIKLRQYLPMLENILQNHPCDYVRDAAGYAIQSWTDE